MWNPTHVEVTVSRARNLKAKGKSGTNDAYVTIKLGKEKFQTTLRERAKDPEWHEQCQFSISEKHSLVKLKVFHRNLIGQDDFLGYVEIPLDPSLVYERPQSKWYNLRNRPGDKGPEKCRGEIEIFITYVVQSISGSHISLNMVEQSKKHLSLKRLASPFEKLHMKGSLKKNCGQLSDSSFHLGNVDSDCEQGGSTLPSSDRKAPVDGTVAGCVREEVESVSEHQVLRDEKHPSKSSVFKFPFASKKKRLQKTSLLSQSTLVLPSMKSAGNEFGTAKEVSKHPPSESSSGFGSRRVSASESQSSSGESFTQEKESSTAAGLSHGIPFALEDSAASSEVKEGSTQEVIIGPEDEMLRLEASESLKDGDASIPLTPVHEDETVSTTADVREDEQKQRKGPLPDHQEILLPSVETENIPEPDFDGIEDNEVMQVKSAENLPAVITEEEEPQLITGDDAITGLNISRSVTESVQSELDLSSPALQYASSDVSEYFTNQTPHRLQSELSVSTQQPTSVLKSDSASFSDSPDLDLGASEPAKPVLQSVGTISDSSDPKLEILTRESVFEDASCDSEAPVSGQLAPVSDTLLLKTNVTFTEVKSLNNKSRNRNDECKGTTDNVTPAVISSTVASLGQPVQQTAGSWREVETKKRSEPQRSESHKQLSMERGEEVIPSAQTLLLPEEILQQFHHYSRDDLIQIILDQRRLLREKEAYIQDLQSYIDNLLVKVIDIQPRLLMTSESCSSSGSTTAAFHISSTKSGKLHPSSDWRESDSKTTDAHVTYKTATDAVSSVTVTASPKVAAPRKLGFRNPFKAKK